MAPDAAPPAGRRSDRVLEHATGAMAVALLGGGFSGLGLQVLPLWSWLEAVALPTIILLAFGLDGVRAAHRLRSTEPTPSSSQYAAAQRRRLGCLKTITAGLVALVIVPNALAHAHHEAWIVSAVCGIFGMGWLALAHFADRGLFYVTGAAQIAACVALFPLGGDRRDVFTLIASGVILWITAIALLLRARRAAMTA